MTIEFDHLFICTSIDAPEIDEVLALGFTEGTPSRHVGQGTANRRIFLHNAMLEFLWVADEQEVQSEAIALTHLWQRWQYRQTGYSPFGIGFRWREATERSLPFNSWAFRPPYLPPELQFDVACTHQTEPMVFVMPFQGTRPDAAPPDRRQPLTHANGSREITAIHITLPAIAPLSEAIQSIAATDLITFSQGDNHWAEVEFDGGRQGRTIEHAKLPLCFRF
jgi:hypothetical protein